MRVMVRYPSILMTAIVAGVFSLAVCALLLADAVYRVDDIPLESPEFVTLKEKLADDRISEQLKQDIRALDLQLRQEYFRELQFTEMGVYLLLGGIVVTLIAGKWAATLRRKIPQPKLKGTGPDSDEQLSRSGVWAVGALVLAVVGTAWAMNASYRSVLPATRAELIALLEREKAESGGGATPASIGPAIAELPSAEEYQKNWPRFRGPDGSGISSHKDVPTEWDAASGEGILWKTAVSLSGVSSPIVWQNRVFLSGGDKDRRAVYCFDTADGSLVWEKEVGAGAAEGGKLPKVSSDTGYAAPTMATDGRFVFAIFATGELAAYDFAGNQAWSRSLGVPENGYGHASSLATYRGWLIVQLDQGTAKDDLSKLFAFDGATGRPIWQVNRPTPPSWSSPIVIEHDGKPQIITCGDPWVIGYSPQAGTELWRVNLFDGIEIGPSPVYSDGKVFVVNDYATLAAIRVDGSGNVTDTHIEWSFDDDGLAEACSPLVTDELVLSMTSFGSLFCFDKKQGGEPLWYEEFDADFVSSPGRAGDHVYLFSNSEEGTVWIIQPTRQECKRIGEATLGEACVTSPAFQDGRIYIRGSKHLFCIGKPRP